MTIKGDVLSYFLDHEGERVSVKQLMTATGYTKVQVRHGVANLRNDSMTNGQSFRDNIEVLVSGDVWRWTGEINGNAEQLELEPAPAPVLRMFEEVVKTVDGSILVKCEDGKFYKLIEL